MSSNIFQIQEIENYFQIQKKIAAQVIAKPLEKPVQYIAAVDCALIAGTHIIAAALIWDYQQQILLEKTTAVTELTFPYIPGLLAFREAPVMLQALKQLTIKPDVVMVDGQGIAHPRRCGIACHIGVELDIPAFGCGKKKLYGRYQMPDEYKGARSLLYAKQQVIGCVLRTRDHIKPLFISVGNKILLDEAVELALMTTSRYRLPEPVRLADKLSKQSKKIVVIT